MSKSGHDSMTTRQRNLQRSHIRMQLSRGQKLSIKLIKELGLGISLDRRIWKYSKMSMGQIDTLIQEIQRDSEHVKLLEILSPQLVRLVEDGSPDLQEFYNALKEVELVSENELCELQVAFSFESVLLLEGILNAAIDRLITNVGTKILNKAMLDRDDKVMVHGSMELPCEILERLRPGNWLNCWAVMALMQISDRPAFIKYDLSIPLDETGSDDRIRPIKRPLASWAKKIAKHRRQAKEAFSDALSLVYFCPINHENSHFTLLEINERDRAIRRYDSMAGPDATQGVKTTRTAKLTKDEFRTLKSSSSEVPTPQREQQTTGAVASG